MRHPIDSPVDPWGSSISTSASTSSAPSLHHVRVMRTSSASQWTQVAIESCQTLPVWLPWLKLPSVHPQNHTCDIWEVDNMPPQRPSPEVKVAKVVWGLLDVELDQDAATMSAHQDPCRSPSNSSPSQTSSRVCVFFLSLWHLWHHNNTDVLRDVILHVWSRCQEIPWWSGCGWSIHSLPRVRVQAHRTETSWCHKVQLQVIQHTEHILSRRWLLHQRHLKCNLHLWWVCPGSNLQQRTPQKTQPSQHSNSAGSGVCRGLGGGTVEGPGVSPPNCCSLWVKMIAISPRISKRRWVGKASKALPPSMIQHSYSPCRRFPTTPSQAWEETSGHVCSLVPRQLNLRKRNHFVKLTIYLVILSI